MSISFSISTYTSTLGTDVTQAILQSQLDAVGVSISALLEGNVTIKVATTVTPLANAAAAAQASGSGLSDFVQNGSGNYTASLDVNSSDATGSFAGGVTGTKFGYGVAILAHEMTHSLGFISNIVTSTGLPDPKYASSPFGALCKIIDGKPYFVGASAVAINDGPVALDASTTYLAHLAGPTDLMYTSAYAKDMEAPKAFGSMWSMIDLAVFQDIGFKNKHTLSSADGHQFVPGSLAQTITGTSGVDTVVLQGARQEFSISNTGVNGVVTKGLNVDTLVGIERVHFSDTNVAFDTGAGQTAGEAFRVYQAAFNRAPDVSGLGYWIRSMDSGISLKTVAEGFVASAEFQKMYGASPTDAALVNGFYSNVLHRAPDPAGALFWTNLLETKATTVAEVLAGFSESAENQAALVGVTSHGVAYVPYLG